MSRQTKLGAVVAVLTIGLATLGATLGWAQLSSLLGPEKETLVYDGDVKADSGGIKLTSWGSGKAEPLSDGYHYYVGPEVLKVTSHGPYQGIVLRLGRPADLLPFLGSKHGFIELRLMPAQVKRVRPEPGTRPGEQTRGRPGGTRGGAGAGARGGGGGGGAGARGGGGGGAGARGGGGGGGRRGGGGGGRGALPTDTMLADGGSTFAVEFTQAGGGGGGRRGGGGGGAARGGGGARTGGGAARGGRAGGARGAAPGGRAGQTGAQPGAAPAGPQEIGFSARNLRLVLFTDQGQMVANEVPISDTLKDERGWYRVAYPLARFAGKAEASQLQAVGIFTGEQEGFYLGQVRLVVDNTAVKSTLKAEPAVTQTGKMVDFSVGLAGGNIDPHIAWDFDAADGVKRQAVGDKVKYIFKQPGDYVVTAVVEDRSGIQEPIRKQIGIRVERGTAVEAATKGATSGGLADSTLGSGAKKPPAIEVK